MNIFLKLFLHGLLYEFRQGEGSPRFAKVRQGSPRFAKVRQGSPRFAKVRQGSPRCAARAARVLLRQALEVAIIFISLVKTIF
jgi:hypothetical protein